MSNWCTALNWQDTSLLWRSVGISTYFASYNKTAWYRQQFQCPVFSKLASWKKWCKRIKEQGIEETRKKKSTFTCHSTRILLLQGSDHYPNICRWGQFSNLLPLLWIVFVLELGNIFCYFHWLPPVWISPLYQGMHCIGTKAKPHISQLVQTHRLWLLCSAVPIPLLSSLIGFQPVSSFVPKIFLNQTLLQTEIWHMNC